MMMRFSRIGHRLLAIVGSVVVAGLIGLALIYASRQEHSIRQENEQSLIKVTESVANGLSAIMIEGHARIGREFADRLKTVKDVLEYRIVRLDGTEAFVDNSTVDKVNDRLGEQDFTGRKIAPDPVHVLAADDPMVRRVIETRSPQFRYETLNNGERTVSILAPIPSTARCRKCHADDRNLRGLIQLTTSLRQIEHDIASTWRMAAVLISVAMILIGFGIYVIAHRTVVSHLTRISDAMNLAAKGNFSVELAVGNPDELGRMAESFNRMSQQLVSMYQGLQLEKSKLSTLIQGAKEGIVVTNASLDVVLVNRAAQEQLGKSEQLIRYEGFLNLFDDEYWMRESLELSNTSNTPRLIHWDGRILSVKASTILDELSTPIGSAALIRDISEEKRLEEELKKRSVTDGLTRLYNRRHFDTTLDYEFKRWKRYKAPLSIIMIDVDHFKKFNDTHGHECGDHVLVNIATVLRAVAESYKGSCMAFRYGGEELVMIAAGTPQDKATRLAEQLRLQIADLVVDGLRVTVSIGVAGTSAHDTDSAEALLKLADDALYEAKHNGRNRICSAPTTSDPAST